MRVGTRAVSDRMQDRLKDHPHACGDKHFIRFRDSLKLGSSPCVWGQGFYIKKDKLPFRIIPMRVGTRRIFSRPKRRV